MQLFVVGPPRSGMTIVTQFLNHHEDIKIFDEIDLIQAGQLGESVIGTLAAFLLERGLYESYRRRARETGDPAASLRHVMSEIARPSSIWGEKNPRYATRLDALKRGFPEAVVLFVLRYEDFAARPKATLDAALGGRGLTFSDIAADVAYPAPDTAGDHQFFRHDAPLPWKAGNLAPLHPAPPARDRIDDDDPAWAGVDALARRFGYQ